MNRLLLETRLLLRNDSRLVLREIQGHLRGVVFGGTLLTVALVLLHGVSIPVCLFLKQAPAIETQVVIWAFLAFMMLGAAMTNAIRLVFEQRDLDLLFASPITSEAVLLSRILGIFLSALLSTAIFVVPLVNGALIGFSWRYSAAYPTWFFVALLASSIGTAVALGAVKVLGAQRARTWVQIIGGVIGAAVYVVLQSGQLFRNGGDNWIWKTFARALVSPPGLIVAEAGQGRAPSLLILGSTAVLAALLSTSLLARTYLTGVQDSSSHSPRRRRRTRRHRMHGGQFQAAFLKDLRLIRRDPLLLSQLLPSIMYVLPAFFGLRLIAPTALIAPLSVVIAVQFSMLLTTVAVDGEEGLDLILSSPMPEIRLRAAKIAAGVVIPLGLALILCGVVVLLGRPGLALMAFVTSSATACACSWVASAEIRPTPRKDILKRRRGGSSLNARTITSVILMIGAALAVGLQAAHAWPWTSVALYTMTVLGDVACFVFVSPRELSGEPQAA